MVEVVESLVVVETYIISRVVTRWKGDDKSFAATLGVHKGQCAVQPTQTQDDQNITMAVTLSTCWEECLLVEAAVRPCIPAIWVILALLLIVRTAGGDIQAGRHSSLSMLITDPDPAWQ